MLILKTFSREDPNLHFKGKGKRKGRGKVVEEKREEGRIVKWGRNGGERNEGRSFTSYFTT
jgi:hypothetical protein